VRTTAAAEHDDSEHDNGDHDDATGDDRDSDRDDGDDAASADNHEGDNHGCATTAGDDAPNDDDRSTADAPGNSRQNRVPRGADEDGGLPPRRRA
jgi:hypothetical protein